MSLVRPSEWVSGTLVYKNSCVVLMDVCRGPRDVLMAVRSGIGVRDRRGPCVAWMAVRRGPRPAMVACAPMSLRSTALGIGVRIAMCDAVQSPAFDASSPLAYIPPSVVTHSSVAPSIALSLALPFAG